MMPRYIDQTDTYYLCNEPTQESVATEPKSRRPAQQDGQGGKPDSKEAGPGDSQTEK